MIGQLEKSILNIVRTYPIKDQSEIIGHLAKVGEDMPQATLSRKLRKLGVVKVHGFYKLLRSTSSTYVGYNISEPNMVIVHTLPGSASALCAEIDMCKSKDEHDPYYGIIATLAGDDVIFIIVRAPSYLQPLADTIERDFS